MLEAALVARLRALPQIDNSNLFAMEAPLGYPTPCVVYSRISTAPEHDLEGETEQAFIMMQVSVYDLTPAGSQGLTKIIRRHLSSWQDDEVLACAWTGETHLIDKTTDTRLYHTALTFMIFADLED